ncbi:hypothetical protein C8Q76DRAFT_681001 [Earliella scabrosa]|nr:hypothetical protein C8Q76DRAFT_681001 [Earliella scabrosa]
MQAPQLSSLELVYLADTSGSDDELLEFVAEAYPRLSYLEIHRYRRDRSEQVDYAHIARLLTALKSLRTVHLNLDFHDDHGPYCDNRRLREGWFETFRNSRGPEIVGILEDCPDLDYVGLLYHGIPSATWVEFHPARCAEPRFVLEYDGTHIDSEPLPHSWCTQNMYLTRYTTSNPTPKAS